MHIKEGIPVLKACGSKKLKGGALYIALIVSILIAITLCLFIFIAKYNQRTVTVYSQSSQLYYNLQSAFEMAQSAYFTDEYNNRWIKNSTNDDSIKIKRQAWGAYLVINAQTKNRHHALSQSGIYGTYMSSDTGLVVADNSRPIGLSGNIVFKGNCFLPKAGTKPAYIEGQSYIGNSGNAAFTRQSPANIPAPHARFVKDIELQRTINDRDSLVTALPQHLSQPFSGPTVVYEITGSRLGNLRLKNNIKLLARDIEIDSTCHFSNILIVCKKVRFKEGFKGKVHVIASDSIITEKKCGFDFPSSFVLLPAAEGEAKLRYIQLNEECRFFGGMLALHPEGTSAGDVFIKLNARSEVNGFVYSGDYMHVEGQVNATAMCNRLLLKTPSAVYENHLLGCTIEPGKHGGAIAIPSIFKQRAALLCCERTDQDRCSY